MSQRVDRQCWIRVLLFLSGTVGTRLQSGSGKFTQLRSTSAHLPLPFLVPFALYMDVAHLLVGLDRTIRYRMCIHVIPGKPRSSQAPVEIFVRGSLLE